MLVHGASKINRLLRLTTLVMPRANLKGLCRPESGECALKIEGHSYAMVESGSHDNASLQFYLFGPDGEKARSAAASGSNAWGGPVDAEVVKYFAKVLELTHPDVKNVCERLRDDRSETELSIVVDDSATCNVHRTHSAVTAMSFANTTRHRDVVLRRESAANEYDRIAPDHPLYEQLTYPMYYWFGEKGWHSGCAEPNADPKLTSFQYAKGRTHMPERLDGAAASPYCDFAEFPTAVLEIIGSVIVDHLKTFDVPAGMERTMGSSIPWRSLATYVEGELPDHGTTLASARQMQNAWDSNVLVWNANKDAEARRVPKPNPAHRKDELELANRLFRSLLGEAWVQNGKYTVAALDRHTNPDGDGATPHLIRCRMSTNNTVDLERFPTLSYAVETAEFTTVETDHFTFQRQRRNGRIIRLPASRWQLSPWLSQEYALDSYCRTLEEGFRYLRNNQSKLLKYRGVGDVPATTAGALAPEPRIAPSVHLPSSVVGSRKFLSNKTADGLAVAARLGNPLLFITVTTNKEWNEIKRRIPAGASPYDYPDIVCRVFHHKLEALRARLLTGAAWGASTVDVDDEGNAAWKYSIKDASGKGYIISVIEFQQRGMPHAHIVLKVRCLTRSIFESNAAKSPIPLSHSSVGLFLTQFAEDQPSATDVPANAPMPSVDKLICARKPTFAVLREYGMIVPNQGITPAPLSLPQLASLESEAENKFYDDSYSVHPQIARSMMLNHDDYFGVEISPTQLLSHMRRLVLDRNDPSGYRSGPLEHGPHPTLSKPDPNCTRGCSHCKKKADGVTCKANYPFAPTSYTHMGDDGFVVYQRGEGDEFIVPYNPWLTLEFESHINVEYAASHNCIAYLYKYLFKGSRGERAKFGFK